MTLQQFRDKYLGKQVEYHSFGGQETWYQCVDLANQYIKEVLNLTPIIGTNAKDFRGNNEFDWIANAPDGVPEPGDLIVWNGRVGGGAGHIAIFLTGNVNSFTSLDQNWSQKQRVTIETHNYNNVSGWLRPKESMADCLLENTEANRKLYEGLVAKATERDEYAKQFQSPAQAKQLIESLKQDVANANQAKKEQEARADSYKQVIQTQVAELAKILDTRQDHAEIKANIESLLNALDDLHKYQEDHRDDIRKWEEKEVELKTEINRLNALLNNQHVLANVELSDLIKELVARLKRIILRGE